MLPQSPRVGGIQRAHGAQRHRAASSEAERPAMTKSKKQKRPRTTEDGLRVRWNAKLYYRLYWMLMDTRKTLVVANPDSKSAFIYVSFYPPLPPEAK
jgi:hypothetical protein